MVLGSLEGCEADGCGMGSEHEGDGGWGGGSWGVEGFD